MKKSMIYRVLIYIAGLLILAMGLTLNTKAGLGVSPIISVSYSVSEITHHNFGNTTLVLYTIFVILELVLHNIREKQYEKRVEKSMGFGGQKNWGRQEIFLVSGAVSRANNSRCVEIC